MISIPEISKILHVDNQNGQLCLWVEVETNSEVKSINIAVIGTGNPIPGYAKVYIGSAVINPFVWHVYTDR